MADNHRRIIYAVLTPEGYQAHRRALTTFAGCYDKHFPSLISGEDRPAIMRIMVKLAKQPCEGGGSIELGKVGAGGREPMRPMRGPSEGQKT